MNINEKNVISNINDVVIYYSNNLARINNQFTLEEEKTLHLIFSHVKPFEKNPTKFKIEKKDFFNKLNLVDNNKYKRYKLIIKSLISKTITTIERSSTKSELIGTIICGSEWFYQKSYFEVSLNPDFMPYIEQLIDHYTKVSLNSIVSFNSKHSLSLYKWFCSWTNENHNENQRYITTKDLKQLFGLDIKDYVYNQKFVRCLFEKKTIKVAISEINEKTNYTIVFKKNKIGNKIQNYEFTWIQKEQEKPVIKKTSKKQISIFDLEKENQKQQNKDKKSVLNNNVNGNKRKVKATTSMTQEQINNMLNNIDKDSEVVFDN